MTQTIHEIWETKKGPISGNRILQLVMFRLSASDQCAFSWWKTTCRSPILQLEVQSGFDNIIELSPIIVNFYSG